MTKGSDQHHKSYNNDTTQQPNHIIEFYTSNMDGDFSSLNMYVINPTLT